MKNHININGQLLQTNKKWSSLKQKQKEKIILKLKTEYLNFIENKGQLPNKQEKISILDTVYSSIREEGIWIPYLEVKKHFFSKLNIFYNSERG